MDFIKVQNTDKCTSCYKCVQNCFTKAIKINKDLNLVEIDKDLCVKCGYCASTCKADIPYVQTNYNEIKQLLKSGKKVYLILDTIYQSDFKDANIHQMRQAVKQLGFIDVIENFTGFAIHRYLAHKNYIETGRWSIETFCVTFNNFVSKFYSDLLEFMTPIETPENITSRLTKEKYGSDIYTVYATTCFAPDNNRNDFNCDYIILTSELLKILEDNNININSFSKDGPIINEFEFIPPYSEKIDTIESCVEALKYIRKNKDSKGHIAPYWCDSCFSSPVFTNKQTSFERKKLYDKYKANGYIFTTLDDINIKQFGDLERFKIVLPSTPVIEKQFSEELITKALHSIGRIEEKDHFDCGACGYQTCRENAIAMLQGKSTKNQCIPYISTMYQESLQDIDKAYKELDEAFALTIPNSRLEKKLKHTREYKDQYIKETGKIKIVGIIENGTYKHVVNALKIAADLHSKGVMSVIGFDKDALVKTIIFHDIGKSQPILNIGDEVFPKDVFENGKMHAERSAELAISNYASEGIDEDIYKLIKYHHHNEKELPSDFPTHLLPMYRLFRVIDGISAGLTRRGNTITFDLVGSVLYIKEHSQNPNYRRFYSIDLYKPEYMKKEYDFEDDLDIVLHSRKYK